MGNRRSQDETVGKLIVLGADFAIRTGAKPVVVSHCTLKLRSSECIAACEEALIQFEGMLRRRPDGEIEYEWANVYRRGLTVTFEVRWYSLDFFRERKDAYRFGPHPFVFRRFGATPDDFHLVHRTTRRRKSPRSPSVTDKR
jgi:hypothetical protein